MTIEFKGSTYSYQMQDAVMDVLDRMLLITPEEFDLVAGALLANKDERGQYMDAVNPQVRDVLECAFEYLDCPEDYINTDSIKENLSTYGLTFDAINALTAEDFKMQCHHAHQQIISAYFADRAAYYQTMDTPTRIEKIALNKEVRNKKQELREATETKLATISAPAPGSSSSTYKLILSELLGGAEKLKQIVDLLKLDPHFSDCQAVSGDISGIWTDEEGLRWKFDVFGCNSSCETIHVNVNNYDYLDLVPQDQTKIIRAQSQPFGTKMNKLPKGQYQYAATTIKDMMLVSIQQATAGAFALCYARAQGINVNLVERMWLTMDRKYHFPTRAELKVKVLALWQQQEQQQASGHNSLADLLRFMLVGPIQGALNSPDSSSDSVVSSSSENSEDELEFPDITPLTERFNSLPVIFSLRQVQQGFRSQLADNQSPAASSSSDEGAPPPPRPGQ